jgi:hypothetical protein
MACRVKVSLEVRFIPMNDVQSITWYAGLLLLLNILKSEICDVASGDSLPIFIEQGTEVQL